MQHNEMIPRSELSMTGHKNVGCSGRRSPGADRICRANQELLCRERKGLEMPRRSWWAAFVLAGGTASLTGCMSVCVLPMYPGKELPDYRTAVIKRGHGIDGLHVDGRTPRPEWFDPVPRLPIYYDRALIYWPRTAIRVAPGQHDLRVDGGQHVIFYTDPGQTYTIFGSKDDPKTIWVEDRTGKVVWGEKPPEDQAAEP